jgi:hypothetical protein
MECCDFPKYENNSLLSEQNKYNYFLMTNTKFSLLGNFENHIVGDPEEEFDQDIEFEVDRFRSYCSRWPIG